MKSQTIYTQSFALISALALLLALFVPGYATAGGTVTVRTSDPNGWLSIDDTNNVAIPYTFVSGPGTAPLGAGSAHFVTTTVNDRPMLMLPQTGVQLADIDVLSYNSYQTANTGVQAVALQMNIDADTTDDNHAWQGRLVYEPYYTHTVSLGQWQTWDTLDDSTNGAGDGNWWFSNGTLASNSGCAISSPCTWSEVMAAYPEIGLHSSFGAVLFKAGGGWSTFDGNVDAFSWGVNDDVTTYDFEPELLDPAAKEGCFSDGYLTFGFKNQGQCVRFVETNKDSR